MTHILVDATSATDRISGLERYTRELTHALARVAPSRDAMMTVLLPQGATWLRPAEGVRALFSPWRSRLATEQLWIPARFATLRPDVAFFPAFPPAPQVYVFGVPTVKTLHDAVPWQRPETLSWKARLYLRPSETFAAERHAAVHTISHTSKAELGRVFPTLRDRLVVSGNGVDTAHFRDVGPRDRTRVAERYALPDRFLLSVGTIEPRKNLPFLLEVIASLHRHGVPVPLVVAGRRGWGYKAFQESIERLSLDHVVLDLGPIPDENLPALYALATAVAVPSVYEGFGLPVIEAMAAGVPVIASHASSLPEAAGDAAILPPPNDHDAWQDAILAIWTQAELRDELRKRGTARATDFTWDAVASRVMDSLLEVAR